MFVNVQPNRSDMTKIATSELEPVMYASLLASVDSLPTGVPFHSKPLRQHPDMVISTYFVVQR